MSKYDLHIRKWAVSLLVFSLRSKTVMALVQVLCVGFYGVKSRFDTYRKECETKLSFNAQVFSIERALNYYLNEYLTERILVTDDVAVSAPLLVYPRESNKPAVTRFFVKARAYWDFRPFTVVLPADLEGNTDVVNRVVALVDRYKFLGTKYIIKYE